MTSLGLLPALNADVRANSISQVFTAILTRGPLCRRDVAVAVGLSQGAVTKLAKPMIAAGFVEEADPVADGPGRPLVPLRVTAERQFAVGFKVMAHEIIGVVIDMTGRIRGSIHRDVQGTDPAVVIDAIVELVPELVAQVPQAAARLAGVGIGIGGHVDLRNGVVRHSPGLHWPETPLADLLSERLSMPVAVANDVNALALAEQWFGVGREAESFAVVTMGAGTGCGLVIGGNLWTGATGAAGEFGHVIVSPDGPLCDCGRRGCLQALTKDEAIIAAATEAAGFPVTSVSEAYELATAGSLPLREVFERAGRAMGRGLAILVNLVNPQMIILSGEGIHALPLLMNPLREQMVADSFSSAGSDCELIARPLPDESWAVGAAACMLRHGVLASLGTLLDTT